MRVGVRIRVGEADGHAVRDVLEAAVRVRVRVRVITGLG